MFLDLHEFCDQIKNKAEKNWLSKCGLTLLLEKLVLANGSFEDIFVKVKQICIYPDSLGTTTSYQRKRLGPHYNGDFFFDHKAFKRIENV